MPEHAAIDRVWAPGDTPWFEYHCWESHDSADAQVWYRSHQQVTVLSMQVNDGEGLTFVERAEAGAPFTYSVKFADGLVWCVFEDELADTTDDWCRPAPPPAP